MLTERFLETANRRNRHKAEREGRRLEEIGAVMDIAKVYADIDREGDLVMETHFARIYQLADDEPERDAAVKAFMDWQRTERAEGYAVESSVNEATELLKANNALFLADGCGPNGRAA